MEKRKNLPIVYWYTRTNLVWLCDNLYTIWLYLKREQKYYLIIVSENHELNKLFEKYAHLNAKNKCDLLI